MCTLCVHGVCVCVLCVCIVCVCMCTLCVHGGWVSMRVCVNHVHECAQMASPHSLSVGYVNQVIVFHRDSCQHSYRLSQFLCINVHIHAHLTARVLR